MPTTEEAIVLVGGLGTRLRAELAGLPKPLAPVAGRPFLAYVLDQLASSGLRRSILATGYLSGAIKDAIGGQWKGMEIAYSVESQPLGTGGAVALAARSLQGNSVHVANGDTYLRFSLAGLEEVVARTGSSLGMALAEVEDVGRFGAVEVLDCKATNFLEKGGSGCGWINAGSYFLTPDALGMFPDREVFSFEEHVLMPLARLGRVAVLQDTADFIDIGIPEDFRKAQHVFAGAV